MSSKHRRGYFSSFIYFFFPAALELEPLSPHKVPGPESELPAMRSKAKTVLIFAVFFSVNILICTELSYLSLSQISSLKKKPILDHCGGIMHEHCAY